MRYAYVFLSANNNGQVETTNRDSSGDEGTANQCYPRRSSGADRGLGRK